MVWLRVDFDHDWDDSRNLPEFKNFVPVFLNPDISVLRDSRGLAVSHIAGTQQFFARSIPMTESAVTDGTSNTILCGQVADRFEPWGDPSNLRDANLGVNRQRDGFGSTDEKGALFMMADGSVRFLSTDIDPKVMAALATPDGDD
jgi:hypothetical protein